MFQYNMMELTNTSQMVKQDKISTTFYPNIKWIREKEIKENPMQYKEM